MARPTTAIHAPSPSAPKPPEGFWFGRYRLLCPEPEFFIFDGVRWSTEPNHTFYEIEEYEAPGTPAPSSKAATAATVPPSRAAISPCLWSTARKTCAPRCPLILESLGIPVEVFHHEVAGAGQNEIGTRFSTLVERADWTMLQSA